ncbi:nuclear transport factor 2 family protein [Kineosporia sp. J2-2]|uniref:Nuclear transport factor 2 family protein n=1 Tax=Kineosporia corallincola TaxID=2835133 RepID=A0ABS5TC39_9ACTN|nr:nuclear transport factor 2 family protein [Kineosporia corallincola]MBT0768649.1 nuclear transport factor 2 family protein [Kineosporia corallincola]
MSTPATVLTPSTESASEALRSLYTALAAGDVAGVTARLHPDVVVVEPHELPYGGIHQGRDAFLHNVLGVMMSHAAVTLETFELYEGADGATGVLHGTLTAHTSGEQLPLHMVEVHRITDGRSTRMEIYLENPAALAAFYRRNPAPASA